MNKIKFYYKKLQDDLKDTEMWINWAFILKEDFLEDAEYFIEEAESRLDKQYNSSKEKFILSYKEDSTLKNFIEETFLEDIIEHHDCLKKRIDSFKNGV